MTRVTGRDNGLAQDYSAGLGTWFCDRLGSRQQLREDFPSKFSNVATKKEVMKKITVGMPVLFKPTQNDIDVHSINIRNPEQLMHGYIVYVHNDREANLVVYDHNGRQFPRRNIPVMLGDELQFPASGYCEVPL